MAPEIACPIGGSSGCDIEVCRSYYRLNGGDNDDDVKGWRIKWLAGMELLSPDR